MRRAPSVSRHSVIPHVEYIALRHCIIPKISTRAGQYYGVILVRRFEERGTDNWKIFHNSPAELFQGDLVAASLGSENVAGNWLRRLTRAGWLMAVDCYRDHIGERWEAYRIKKLMEAHSGQNVARPNQT